VKYRSAAAEATDDLLRISRVVPEIEDLLEVELLSCREAGMPQLG